MWQKRSTWRGGKNEECSTTKQLGLARRRMAHSVPNYDNGVFPTPRSFIRLVTVVEQATTQPAVSQLSFKHFVMNEQYLYLTLRVYDAENMLYFITCGEADSRAMCSSLLPHFAVTRPLPVNGGMAEDHGAQEPGNSPRLGPEVVKRLKDTKERAAQIVRS